MIGLQTGESMRWLLSWLSLVIAAVLIIPIADALAADARLSPVRRTTIMTADPDASLRFWRDHLGFTVEYDNVVDKKTQLALISPGATRGRTIALRQGDTLGGSIGLSWTDNMKPRTGACDPTGQAGATAVLLLTDDLAAIYQRLQAANVPFVTAPVQYSESRGPTDAFTVFDPNCVRVAFAQIARESFEESISK